MAALDDATGIARAVRAGEADPREVVERAIARIEELDGTLNAVAHSRFEEALAEVDAGLPDGPLRGVPVLVKDLYADVAGLPSTRGSRLWADHVPAADSELVRRYRAAGAVVLGTTNVPELGLNASTEGALLGTCRNPRDTGRSTGGSSGGSAVAVATGMVPVATASDGGGSIRIPAAMNGLFGLKPGRGRVSPAPYPSLLAGPVSVHHALTTTVRDSALLLDLTHGSLPGDAFGAPTPAASWVELAARAPGRLRVGLAVAPGDGEPAHPEVLAVLRSAADLLSDLGHEVVETVLDHALADSQGGGAALMGAGLVAAVDARLAELGRGLREDDLEPFTRLLLEHHRSTTTGADVVRALETAQRVGWRLGRQLSRADGGFDVLLSPTLAEPVPALGVLDTARPETIWEHAGRYAAFTSVYNLTGQPAMSLPLGTDAAGLPVGVQVSADLGREGLLLALATQVEAAAPWQRHAPTPEA
ncbi:amidase [Nocardioides sp. Arc9.136]|uniref:amidase n=1 Tax=Nocardioides sp. Arc9.136 TaxID=2996826 RepID=UPI002666048A|nr:amidase [Nocardioides sp. Arc9.136]WKN46999.1 amidase [Nocardioides sp. Arc9.136]